MTTYSYPLSPCKGLRRRSGWRCMYLDERTRYIRSFPASVFPSDFLFCRRNENSRMRSRSLHFHVEKMIRNNPKPGDMAITLFRKPPSRAASGSRIPRSPLRLSCRDGDPCWFSTPIRFSIVRSLLFAAASVEATVSTIHQKLVTFTIRPGTKLTL